MADSEGAQDVMKCNICQTSPLQKHCNTCNVSFCDPCISKHLSSDVLKPHEIVQYKMRNEGPIFPDCVNHAKQRCEMYCQQCDIPVCIKCVDSGFHKNHDLEAMLRVLGEHKDFLTKETKELEQSINPVLKETVSKLQNQISHVLKNHDQLLTIIEQHGAEWHRQIDVIINRRKQEAEDIKNQDTSTLEKLKSDAADYQSTVHNIILENKTLVKSNDIKQMKNYNSKIEDFRKILKKYEYTPSVFEANKIPDIDELFGTVKSSSIYEQPCKTEPKDFDFKHQFNIVCPCPDEYWISGSDRKIKRFQIPGSLQQTVTTTTGNYPAGIAYRGGDLIYSDWEDKSVNRIRDGKIKKIISLEDWKPGRVCSTTSGELLVCMYKDNTPKKVVRYSITGISSTDKQTIHYDRSGNPWFSEGIPSLFIDENKNEDLCASDNKAKQVVVITRSTKVRFKYFGSNLKTKFDSFDPCGIATDQKSQILVADYENRCIHVLNQTGQFLRYVDNIESIRPIDISIDVDNALYVADNTIVRKIKYSSK